MKILLIIPPFSQINTAYPSVTNLSGFLQKEGYDAESLDLSLKVILRIFSPAGLTAIFDEAEKIKPCDESVARIINLKERYISVIDTVIQFLQGKNQNSASRIIQDGFLPQGESFSNLQEEGKYFGTFGITDKANYFCSLVIEDLTRFIKKTVSPEFGLSKYADHIAISTPDFSPFKTYLDGKPNLIDKIIEEETLKIIEKLKPEVVGYTIPFPGNLLGALISARTIKNKFPEIKIVFGGGYINTELRKLSDPGIFKYTDFITFDDGEIPLKMIISFLSGIIGKEKLVRTAVCDSSVKFINPDSAENITFNEMPAPSLKGINPGEYISMTEILNPMLKLWTHGFMNKLTAAHGCYWKRCTFCDVTLDYIGRYSPARAKIIVNWMESLMRESGNSMFHFTDEAAPPALLKEVAIEILRRNLVVSWWGNIRFENSFSSGLCKLLAESGCIAVSGGLEIADDRLLKLIDKGLTISQVARVCKNFQEAGIMVHSYLMYGFPGQTEQETVNSLEIVRQFFEAGLIDSGFWHRFALTVHSPVAKNPEKFGIKITSPGNNPFANNELQYIDLSGNEPGKFAQGLRKSMYNFMFGNMISEDISCWFDFEISSSTVNKNYVKKAVKNQREIISPETVCIWNGAIPYTTNNSGKKKKLIIDSSELIGEWLVEEKICSWLIKMAARSLLNGKTGLVKFSEWQKEFPGGEEEFQKFTNKFLWKEIRENFLICI